MEGSGSLFESPIPTSEATAVMATLVLRSIKSLSQSLTHCAWRDYPTIHIHTRKDRTIEMDSDQIIVNSAKKHGLENLVGK